MALRRALVVSFVLASIAAPSGAAAPPTISFEKDAVVASGVTPGGKVVWFSVAREIAEHTATIVPRQAIAEDEGRDGMVRLELDRDVPFQSIWVAVDLTTGAAAVAVPKDYPLRRFELPSGNLHRGDSEGDWIEDRRGYVALMLVRREKGAWWSLVGDGGSEDDDGLYDGRLSAPLSQLQKVEGGELEAPESFIDGDLVVVIDPNQMEVGLGQPAEVSK